MHWGRVLLHFIIMHWGRVLLHFIGNALGTGAVAFHNVFGFRTDYQIATMRQLKKILRLRNLRLEYSFFIYIREIHPPKIGAAGFISYLKCRRRY